MTNTPILEILAQAKKLAQQYRALTGKPLGITGEVAEYEAARILGVALTPARQAGYDAIEDRDGHEFRVQIKGRCILDDSKPGQRIGSIDVKKEFDAVLLVLLDGNFEATAIYEASRGAVINALTKPGSKARNERGALSVSKFKSIGCVRWQRSVKQMGSNLTFPTPPAFARTPEPPYYAVIFSSLRTEGDNGYGRMADRMVELAARQPGFLGVENVRGADGFGITVSYWASAEAISSWKADVEHLAAQEMGKRTWYEHYELRVAKVERAYSKPAA